MLTRGVREMVDPDRVRRLLTVLERYRTDLVAPASADHYRRRYLVQSAAQACIDIANHLIASEGWRVPENFADSFTVLEEHTVIEPVLAAAMRDLAGMRNVLVHQYADVDDTRVAAAVEHELGDFDDFARAVTRLLAEDAESR